MRIALVLLSAVFGFGSPLWAEGPISSGIDARFKLSRLQSENSGATAASTSSPSVSFYQRILGQTLASHCHWFPHDSLNAQMLFRRCGGVAQIPRIMGRFLNEPQAAELGFPLFVQPDGVYFLDLPDGCSSL